MRAKKHFGQHFLRETHMANSIARLCESTENDTLVEIGPGRGMLTRSLLTETPAKTIVAIEKDRELIPHLESTITDPRFEIVSGDAASHPYLEMSQLQPGRQNVAVGNLPYNVGTQIYFQLLEARDRFRRLVLMFQREVGERITARPGSKAYGSLSVATALWAEAKVAIRLPPHAFNPPPKVHSVVVVVDISTTPLLDVAGDPAGFESMVRAAFGMRRKTLVNALGGAGWDRAVVEEALERNQLNPKTRAEALHPSELASLWRTLKGTDLASPPLT